MDKKEKIKQGDKPIVGNNIKRLRIQTQLRNVDVVAKLQLAGIEIGTSTLSKIERGYSNPTVEMLIALTEIFHCDFNAFFYDADRK
jgi:transcriptional regulator with XRE-family HTH domain